MTFTIDFSFRNDSFINSLLDRLKTLATIESIKCSVNFEWIEIEKVEELNLLKFEQLSIETETFGTITIQVFESALPRVFVDRAPLSNMDIFINLIEEYFLNLICFGKICESIDNVLQNVETPDSWRRRKRMIPEYVELFPNLMYTNEREKKIISLESLPGHYHLMNYDEKLWFGSCWKMYFSTIYYKYIPKFLFDGFQDCFENKVFENKVRKITLFKNPEDFDLPENRSKQWSFRRALGIDSITHELTKQSNRIEPKNLPVIISRKNCRIGNIKVELIFENKIEIKEFLDDGITIVFEDKRLI